MIKLGSQATETATGLPGMVTQMLVEMNLQRYYLFQPRGLNPEDGTPVKRFWCVETRISGGVIIPDVKLPMEVLGTEVEDSASGFAGVVTAITLHISGCVHVTVQPKGKLTKTNAAIEAHDFDIRRLKGDAIKPLTKTERAADQAEKPSRENITRYQPRMSE